MHSMIPRCFLYLTAAVATLAAQMPPPFEVEEATIAQVHDGDEARAG